MHTYASIDAHITCPRTKIHTGNRWKMATPLMICGMQGS